MPLRLIIPLHFCAQVGRKRHAHLSLPPPISSRIPYSSTLHSTPDSPFWPQGTKAKEPKAFPTTVFRNIAGCWVLVELSPHSSRRKELNHACRGETQILLWPVRPGCGVRADLLARQRVSTWWKEIQRSSIWKTSAFLCQPAGMPGGRISISHQWKRPVFLCADLLKCLIEGDPVAIPFRVHQHPVTVEQQGLHLSFARGVRRGLSHGVPREDTATAGDAAECTGLPEQSCSCRAAF